ncbi:MAG TPA: hypothetical protein DIS90_02930 [Cytophagales bacterium]|nr:hypothetical protein [Cytophagales bacterium]HCR54926.1 hypothetical protein [Cytophagales bacterium]
MTAAAKSIYYFGIYLIVLGVTLTVSPNFLLTTFRIAETSEIWIRVLGAVVFNLGLYYMLMAPSNHTLFLTLSIYTRGLILLWFVVFVAIGWAPVQLILFGLVDGAGALWTMNSLRKK